MSATLESRQNYAEFDEFIDYQIQKTRQGVKLTDVVTAACGVALLTISYLLVFVVLDHWVIPGGFGYGMRLTLLSGLLVASLGLIGWKVALPWFRTVTRLYAAKSLEGISPDLQSNLLNYVDLRDSGRDVSPAIIRSIEKRAAVTLSHTEVDDAFDRRPLLRLSYGLLAAVVVFSMYTLFSPKKVWPSVARVLAPWAELSVSTQTEFLKIVPGQDVDVIAGQNLEVSVDLRGEIPAEVNLYFTTDDRRFVNERVNLAATGQGLKEFGCILNGENSAGLLQSLSYRIEAGDARTRTFRAIIRQPPSAKVTALHYDYPDYMELANESPPGADIHAWEGTRIAIEAGTNMPVKKAWVHFSDEEQFPTNPEPLRMTIDETDGRRLSVVWQPIHREDRSFPAYYRIQCETDDGTRNPAPAIHSIQIDVDKQPDLVAVAPSTDLEVPANAIVPFLAKASDPDFRLSNVTLRLQHGKQAIQREIYSGNDDRTKSIYDLKLEEFNLRPGDQVEWWLEARDNRHVEGPDRRDATRMRVILDSNLRTTPHLKLTITAPVDEQEAKEQHQFDRDQLEEKLDERNQTPNEAAPEGDPNEAPDPDNRNFDPEDAPQRTDPNEAPAGDENSDEPEDGTQKATGESGDTNEGEGKSGEGTTQSEGADGSETGAKSGEDGNTGAAESAEGSGDTGEQGPLSNTGEDDQEVLRELLNREAQRQQAQNENGKPGASDPNDPSNDTRNDDGTQNSDSPNAGSKPGENTDSENTEPSPDGSNNDANNSQENNPDGAGNTDNRPSNPDGNDPATPDSGEEGSKPNPTNENANSGDTPKAQPNSDMPGDDPGNDATDPQSNSDTPGEGPSTPSEATPPTDNENPSQNPDSESGSNPGESETGNPGENPDAPNSENTSDNSSNPQGNPSGEGQNNNSNSGQKQNPSGDPSGNPQSKPGSSGQPGKSNSTGQSNSQSEPGKSGEGGSDGEGGKSGSSQSGTGSKSAKRGSGEPGGKSGTAGDSPSESGSKNGGSESSNESSEQPGEGNPGGDDTSGKGTPSKNESSGKTGSQPSDGSKSGSDSTGKSGGGKSGKGAGKGSSGQSSSSGGKAGQGGGNAQGGGNPTEGGQTGPASKTGGERIIRDPNDLDANDAVQGQNAGGSVSDPNTPPAEDGNLEDKLKATNMVLKRLKEDMKRGEVDDELLKKLGWTERDMKRFTERLERKLERPKSDDPRELARQRQFEESLKSLNLKKSGGQRSDPIRDKRATNNFSDRRMPVPLEYRRAFEDYTKRLARQQKGRSPSSDK